MSGEAATANPDVQMEEELAGRMQGLLAQPGGPPREKSHPSRGADFLDFEVEEYPEDTPQNSTPPAAPTAGPTNAPPAAGPAPTTADTAAEIRLKELELKVLRAQLELQRARSSDGQTFAAPVRITPKDVNLEKFYGHSDRNARVMSPDFFLPLLLWLQRSVFTLKVSGLHKSMWVPTLLQHLAGAAGECFSQIHADSDTSTWSLDTAKAKIAALVPDSAAFFTSQAMKMQFHARTLANDIERYALLMRHGEMEVNGSALAFQWLQRKMLQAKPDIFTIATTEFNRALVFGPDFAKIIRDAQQIVNLLATNGKLSLQVGSVRHDPELRLSFTIMMCRNLASKRSEPAKGMQQASRPAQRVHARRTLKHSPRNMTGAGSVGCMCLRAKQQNTPRFASPPRRASTGVCERCMTYTMTPSSPTNASMCSCRRKARGRARANERSAPSAPRAIGCLVWKDSSAVFVIKSIVLMIVYRQT